MLVPLVLQDRNLGALCLARIFGQSCQVVSRTVLLWKNWDNVWRHPCRGSIGLAVPPPIAIPIHIRSQPLERVLRVNGNVRETRLLLCVPCGAGGSLQPSLHELYSIGTRLRRPSLNASFRRNYAACMLCQTWHCRVHRIIALAHLLYMIIPLLYRAAVRVCCKLDLFYRQM